MSPGERRLVTTIEVPDVVSRLDDAEYDAWLESRYADIVASIQQDGSPSAKSGPAA